jgi:hypothetical protein
MKIKLNKETSTAFNKKYGENAAKDFHRILCGTGKLTQVANHFGFTRAYASMLFKDLYPVSFIAFKKLRHDYLKVRA